jgi:hypothetical protein
MMEYKDEKLGRGFLQTAAPTKISLNTPPHIVSQEENSLNIEKLSREPPVYAPPRHPPKKFSCTTPFAEPFEYEEGGEAVVEEENDFLST